MRPVGTKTLMSMAMLGLVAGLVFSLDLLRLDRLGQLSHWVAFLIGAFATLAGSAVVSFWRLWEKSEYYFGYTRTRPHMGSIHPEMSIMLDRRDKRRLALSAGHPSGFDLPPFVQRSVYISIFLCVGLITIQDRSVALLVGFPEKLAQSSHEYCEEAEDDEEYEAPEMQGCRLVVRAYELGYKRSLGECAPSEEDETKDICTLRQRDEPYLHYAWRLLNSSTSALAAGTTGKQWSAMRTRFERKLAHVETLIGDQRDTVAANPRASHHLFTNLPDPQGTLSQKAASLLSTRSCVEHYAKMQHLAEAGDHAGARFLDHALGQLLFNPAYKPVGGHCQELAIHWDAREDACQKLAESPESFLTQTGAIASVRTMLARYRRKKEVTDLSRSLRDSGYGDDDKSLPLREVAAPDRIVSFQCFLVGTKDAAAVRSHDFKLDGYSFAAREIQAREPAADGRGQIQFLQQLATLLSPGFHYGRLMSRESLVSEDGQAARSSLDESRGYALSSLEFLRDADLFLGHPWIEDRPDLLQVYPFHVHLKNYVQVFRTQYRRERGRL